MLLIDNPTTDNNNSNNSFFRGIRDTLNHRAGKKYWEGRFVTCPIRKIVFMIGILAAGQVTNLPSQYYLLNTLLEILLQRLLAERNAELAAGMRGNLVRLIDKGDGIGTNEEITSEIWLFAKEQHVLEVGGF